MTILLRLQIAGYLFYQDHSYILFPNAIQRFEFIVLPLEFPTDHLVQDFEMFADKDSVRFGQAVSSYRFRSQTERSVAAQSHLAMVIKERFVNAFDVFSGQFFHGFDMHFVEDDDERIIGCNRIAPAEKLPQRQIFAVCIFYRK